MSDNLKPSITFKLYEDFLSKGIEVSLDSILNNEYDFYNIALVKITENTYIVDYNANVKKSEISYLIFNSDKLKNSQNGRAMYEEEMSLYPSIKEEEKLSTIKSSKELSLIMYNIAKKYNDIYDLLKEYEGKKLVKKEGR